MNFIVVKMQVRCKRGRLEGLEKRVRYGGRTRGSEGVV